MTGISYYTESGQHRRATIPNTGLAHYIQATQYRGDYTPNTWLSYYIESAQHRAITVHRDNTASGNFTSNTRIPYYTAQGDPTPNTGHDTAQGDSTLNTGLCIVHSTAGHPIQRQGYHITQHRGNSTPNTWQSDYTALKGFHSKRITTILHRGSTTQGGLHSIHGYHITKRQHSTPNKEGSHINKGNTTQGALHSKQGYHIVQRQHRAGGGLHRSKTVRLGGGSSSLKTRLSCTKAF